MPALLGALTGAMGLFERPRVAVRALNTFALRVAFPALIVDGIADAAFRWPEGIGFWLVHPLALGLALGVLAGARRLLGPLAGPVALTTSFGNVAYIGLPLVGSVMGEGAVGVAALAVAVHVTLSLLVGPWLLLRWGGGAPGGTSPWRVVLRQPLLWAPAVGMAMRLLPPGARSGLLSLVSPLGGAAAPVALFLLGLYLHTERDRLRGLTVSDVWPIGWKLAVLPVCTMAAVIVVRAAVGLAADQGTVLLLLSGMPVAITTFALAHDLGVGTQAVARAVVGSTVLAALAIPMWLVVLGL